MTIRVLIADDHELFRGGLKQLLLDELEDVAVREAGSFDEALEALSRDEACDLLLMDLCMPGLSGPEGPAALSEAFPDAKLVVVSASQARADMLSALNAGACGYIPKSLPACEIAAALKRVIEGQIFVPASFGLRAAGEPIRPAPGPGAPMTARQRQVLHELLAGQSSKQIARVLGIAEGTVKIHLAAVYRSLGVRTRAEAIAKMAAEPDRRRTR